MRNNLRGILRAIFQAMIVLFAYLFLVHLAGSFFGIASLATHFVVAGACFFFVASRSLASSGVISPLGRWVSRSAYGFVWATMALAMLVGLASFVVSPTDNLSFACMAVFLVSLIKLYLDTIFKPGNKVPFWFNLASLVERCLMVEGFIVVLSLIEPFTLFLLVALGVSLAAKNPSEEFRL